MNLLFFNPRMMASYVGTVQVGTLALASYLDAEGFSVSVIDNNSPYKVLSDQDLIGKIKDLNPDVIGISVYMPNAFNSYRLLRAIRDAFPDKLVIGGGMHSYDAADEIAEQGFDLTFFGEAEKSLTEFLELARVHKANLNRNLMKSPSFIRSLDQIPGILYHKNGQISKTGPYKIIDNLDELPFLNYELLNLDDFIFVEKDLSRTDVVNFVSFQRGCPYECTFCKADFMGGELRNNSAEYMVKQIKALHESYGITQFRLADSNFAIPKKRMNEFCDLMISSGLGEKIRMWIQFSSTIPMSDKELSRLRMSGVRMISMGVERFDDEIRKIIVKPGTRKQVMAAIKRMKKNDIKAHVNVLVNFPTDDHANLKREKQYLLDALDYTEFYGVHYLVPVPGTPIYDEYRASNRWYLREDVNLKKLSYYDRAFDITTQGIEFNLFGLPKDQVDAIRSFKEDVYVLSMKKLHKSFIFQLALFVDTLMGRVSYTIYKFSPSTENVIFFPFLIAREYVAKIYKTQAWYN
jgi:anaerobic magnesium-protoporphyrin IX monomethyl ester cyclase